MTPKETQIIKRAIYDQFFSVDGIAFSVLKNRLKLPKAFSKEEHEFVNNSPYYNNKINSWISFQELRSVDEDSGITFTFCVDGFPSLSEWRFFDFTFLTDILLPMSYDDYHKYEAMLNL